MGVPQRPSEKWKNGIETASSKVLGVIKRSVLQEKGASKRVKKIQSGGTSSTTSRTKGGVLGQKIWGGSVLTQMHPCKWRARKLQEETVRENKTPLLLKEISP